MKSYFDIQGDGGSDIIGQVHAQQEAIRAAMADVRHVVAVGSGKGGVGKSTVTMALGQSLRAAGHAVAILDADFNGPCQAQMAGLEGAPWVPTAEGGIGLPRRRDGLGVISCGSFLPAASPMELESVVEGDEFVWRATKEFSVLGQLLSSVAWGHLDYLLMDLPPGSERTVQFAGFLDRAAFVLVTIPSDISRGVVARSISALERSGKSLLGYVENMAGYYCRGCDEIRPLFPASKTSLSIPCLGAIPFDPDLAALCDAGWPEAGDRQLKSLAAVEELGLNLTKALE